MALDTLDRRPHLPSRIAEAIQREIAEGRLQLGDRLPGEQILAVTFGVSRNVVREAIARLRSDGVVQSRQGVGAFVVRSAATPSLRIDLEALNDRVLFTNVFELRAMLEVRAAGLAAKRGTAAQRAAITAALHRMRGKEKRGDAGVDADLDFHRAVALATGNDYIAKVVSFVSEHMRESIFATRMRPGVAIDTIVDITIAEHEDIHAAIMAGSPNAAREAMGRHITNAAQRVGITISTDD
ncbi:FadR/GntR family transcriptional regulator [Lichenihabitans psoromatis]|uniref:FadR/GntR family transcriptional regulator n=1 Tax=Lichenihabitans psoromatis TaxID=2528642 RepID=UPI0010385200|nr:FadR/GntR family transcriptional regulator [Lichenihabitans psoromatis]